MKNKEQNVKEKAINITINLAFGLYIADFFIMPFAYGEIDLEIGDINIGRILENFGGGGNEYEGAPTRGQAL